MIEHMVEVIAVIIAASAIACIDLYISGRIEKSAIPDPKEWKHIKTVRFTNEDKS
jgi:hypothetical protein